MGFFFPFKEKNFPFFPMTSWLRTWTPITVRRSRRRFLLVPGLPTECHSKDRRWHLNILWTFLCPLVWLFTESAGWGALWVFLVWKVDGSSAASRSSGQIIMRVRYYLSYQQLWLSHIFTQSTKAKRREVRLKKRGRDWCLCSQDKLLKKEQHTMMVVSCKHWSPVLS